MSISLFGISLHAYGFIVGVALAIALWLIEKKAKQINFSTDFKKYSEETFWWCVLGSLLGGVVGARMWHVATDYHLYVSSLINTLYIWNGGLSILGGILGGVIGLIILIKIKFDSKKRFKKIFFSSLDLAVFGIPFAQAVGRFANYVNQELYGLPTNLPWGISIDIANRVAGYEEFALFHPLFLYEAILMFLFGVFVWQRDKIWKIGEGKLVLLYIWYYSGVRFILEFLRIDKSEISILSNKIIGVNQGIVLIIFIGMSMWWFYELFYKKNRNEKINK